MYKMFLQRYTIKLEQFIKREQIRLEKT